MIRLPCLYKYWKYRDPICKYNIKYLSNFVLWDNKDVGRYQKPSNSQEINLKNQTFLGKKERCTFTKHQNILNISQNSSNFGSNARTFSTSAVNRSLSDRIGQLYAFRQRIKEETPKFFKKYSPATMVKAAPVSWQPYLQLTRVDKPIGTWLLYLPCAFSICLATPYGSLPSFYYLGLFGVGAFLMRGAGCIINDMWDRDIDKYVERTKDRPLTSGKISMRNATVLLAVQLSLSLGILLSLNTTCIMIGFASMIPVILYPYAKRVTYYPQAVLGLTFNIGAIMGYTAVTGTTNWNTILPLYIGCFLWTMYYDTVYALQDAEDDAALGIKSTALLFTKRANPEEISKLQYSERMEETSKDRSKIAKTLKNVQIGMLGFWSLAIAMENLAFPAYVIWFILLLKTHDPYFRPSDKEMCHKKFLENRNKGLFFLVGIILGILINSPAFDKRNEDKTNEAQV